MPLPPPPSPSGDADRPNGSEISLRAPEISKVDRPFVSSSALATAKVAKNLRQVALVVALFGSHEPDAIGQVQLSFASWMRAFAFARSKDRNNRAGVVASPNRSGPARPISLPR